MGELRICSPEGRVVLYDHMSSLVASSIPSVGIADSTVVGVLDISETEEEEICALSSVMEVSTVEGGEGIIDGGEYGWGWNSSDLNFLSLHSACLLP